MARRAKIGILRARHDSSVDNISDQACLEMLFSNPRNNSVFDYWQYVIPAVGSTSAAVS